MLNRMINFASVDRKWNEVKTSEHESYETSNGRNDTVSLYDMYVSRQHTEFCIEPVRDLYTALITNI
jgi:hypothetical protein